MARDTPERSPAELVRLEVIAGAGPPRPPPGRRRRTLRHLAAAAVLAALGAGAAPALLSGVPAPRRAAPDKATPPPLAQARLSFGDPNDPGVDAIAAAFKGPLRCLSLTFASADPSYARTAVGTGGTCAAYAATEERCSACWTANGAWSFPAAPTGAPLRASRRASRRSCESASGGADRPFAPL